MPHLNVNRSGTTAHCKPWPSCRGVIIIFIYCNWVVTRWQWLFFTCKQNIKLVTTKFKSGGLHEKHVVATWNLGNHLSIYFWAQGNHEKPVSRWPVAGPSEY